MYSEVAVLGCGWTGILVSYFLLERFPRINIVCIDKDIILGGLLKSEFFNGFVFDIGGSHIIFSKYKNILKEMLMFLGNNVVEHRRRTYIYLDNVFVSYPFENGMWILPPDIRADILVSFVKTLIERTKNPNWKPRNLREWIYGFFGEEIAKLYLEPYNEKIWKRNLNEIDVDWIYVPGRLPVPSWRDVVRSGAGVPTEGYKEQARFFYPLKGGIQSLYEAVLKKVVAKGVKIIKNMKVKKIRKKDKRWIINDYIKAKKIVSTIPLNELVETLDIPEYIMKLARKLDYNSVAVVGLALRKKAPNMHWVYVPDKSIEFHRYAWLSNYSPHNTPDNSKYSSLIAEITIPRNQRVDKKRLINRTINGLKQIGVLSESEKELLFSKVWINAYGYPIHTITTAKVRTTILEYLREQGIVTVGRWGTWKYMNMDKIFKEIKELSAYFSKG